MLNAKQGKTGLLIDGKPPAHYMTGVTHKLTVVPANAPDPTWFLIDAGGVGKFSAVPSGGGATDLKVKCDGTRAAFQSEKNTPIDIFWTAPSGSSDFGGEPFGNKAVALRVAAATSKGNITINAAILNFTAPALPSGGLGYFCTRTKAAQVAGTGYAVPMQECVSMPTGTVGALTMSACEASCFAGNGAYFCARCAHVYDPAKDDPGKMRAFEDLPESWACPLCGAPKSAYAKQLSSSGKARWVHD
jgi:rubredoxin